MELLSQQLPAHNNDLLPAHQKKLRALTDELPAAKNIIEKLRALHIALPTWALGTGGTRFGRFPGGGEPRSLEEKLEDAALLNSLTRSCNAVSLHLPWDKPGNLQHIKATAAQLGLQFDAVNSNTFQDQKDQDHSYKFGSLQHTDAAVRNQAIEHIKEVMEVGEALGSSSITVWLADGSSFPGQLNFCSAFQNTLASLKEAYDQMPKHWKMYIEYKAFEPNFYSMTVGDWGQALLYANKLGPQAYTLVDLGHHLPNANVEQIVALLLMEGKLGGFHFNDSQYGDDDLTVGSINPYRLFLIFAQLVEGMDAQGADHSSALAWMIDASHNLKDPLEDLMQSIEAIKMAYAQALLIDAAALKEAQQKNDVAAAQEILQAAYRTDVRPLLAEARLQECGALQPLQFYRQHGMRQQLVQRRGWHLTAAGL